MSDEPSALVFDLPEPNREKEQAGTFKSRIMGEVNMLDTHLTSRFDPSVLPFIQNICARLAWVAEDIDATFGPGCSVLVEDSPVAITEQQSDTLSPVTT